jgi:hypothetical protein
MAGGEMSDKTRSPACVRSINRSAGWSGKKALAAVRQELKVFLNETGFVTTPDEQRRLERGDSNFVYGLLGH